MTRCAGAVLVLLLAFPVRAEEPAAACETCSPAVQTLVPVARILVVDAGMYAGLAGIWPDAFGPRAARRAQFEESWTRPPYAEVSRSFFELDGDPWWINGPLHAVYGSEAYIAARDFGHSPAIAFVYATLASFTWEYLIESWFHRPSGIDLAWTPFAGAVLGELRFQLLHLADTRIDRRPLRILFMSLLDPLGQLERLILQCRL